MSEAKLMTAGSAPDAEVELSARDLLELSGPGDSEQRVQEPRAKTKIVSVEPSAPASQKHAAPAAAPRAVWFETVAALLILAVGAGGALYFVSTSYRAGRSIAQEQTPRSQLPAPALQGEGKPLLYANPFDANEVFEFPAGTTEAEARDEVAEILMARAMERQRQFDARVSRNR